MKIKILSLLAALAARSSSRPSRSRWPTLTGRAGPCWRSPNKRLVQRGRGGCGIALVRIPAFLGCLCCGQGGRRPGRAYRRLVTGANGAKSKIIAATDYSNGNDKIIGKPGIKSIKDLKGKKVGLELTLVEHLLLLKALEMNGLKQSDVELVNAATNDTPQTLASGQVDAIGAWYPIAGQALTQVANSTPLFTSADAPGLIYDVVAVNPVSLNDRKDDWGKFLKVYFRCIDYILDPKTEDDAVKIMAAKVGADPVEYKKNIPGTKFLTLKEAKAVMKKGDGLGSLYGSLTIGDKFNVDNKVYKESQKPASYVAPSLLQSLE